MLSWRYFVTMATVAMVNDGLRLSNYRGKFQVKDMYCLENIGLGSSKPSPPPSDCEVLKKPGLGRVKVKFPTYYIYSYLLYDRTSYHRLAKFWPC